MDTTMHARMSVNDRLEAAKLEPFRTDVPTVGMAPIRQEDYARWKAPRSDMPHRTRLGYVLGATYFSMYMNVQYVVVTEDELGFITCIDEHGDVRRHLTAKGRTEIRVAMPLEMD